MVEVLLVRIELPEVGERDQVTRPLLLPRRFLALPAFPIVFLGFVVVPSVAVEDPELIEAVTVIRVRFARELPQKVSSCRSNVSA